MQRGKSIRLRLAGFAIVVVASTMLVTWFGLTLLFERNIERRAGLELDAHLEQIIGGLRFQSDGTAKLSREIADPRFGKVFGGLYFQVATPEKEVLLKSRSLWDTELDLPLDALTFGEVHVHTRSGPNNTVLLLHESRIDFNIQGVMHPLIVTVGIDKSEILVQRAGFARDLVPALAILALVLLLGFAFQIIIGIRPLDRLRIGVSDVRSGKAKRLPTSAPTEVVPLIDEVNSLLDQQDDSIVRARDRAADLAHGLKTPLTALGTDIQRLRKVGVDDIANDIELLSARMRKHLDRELALARDRHGRQHARTQAKSALNSIISTLEKTPNGEFLAFENSVPEFVELAVEQGDFLEVMGNLLENACRFSMNAISIECSVRDEWASILIKDDGPGVAESKVAHIAKRGVRLDTSGTGSGLGLAIVKDILDAYGGQLTLQNVATGGLCAVVTVPVAPLPTSKENQ
ncbi:MAG TPA: HAMP domain-containing histidine kinase [Roseobacter sp.]|uniref:histidine kinase n=1 Tax=marine sediment metagenome TaxID=412755 RepID=A0A0F9T896_9ZZZZ|nr:HAMP domain-containing histidine kinase [Roseobacter sp.]HEC70728.1 HAMP domain-containing histidine kinase [Roseobacter sp.]